MDRLSEMEAFISVVDRGGFTDAADKLGVSKSAVSKHVAALEARLGVRLLNRTTRRVSPTEIGLTYYDRARGVLNDAQAADEIVTAMQSSPRGNLNVSVPVSFGVRFMSPAVAAFLRHYPDVSVNMNLDDRFVDVVAEGYDVAIRIGQLVDSSLMARRLASTTAVVLASPEYLKAHGTPERIEDLSEHRLLHYSIQATSNYWRLTTKTGEERQIRIGGALAANNGDVLLSGAVEGIGIAMLPDFFLTDELETGRLVRLFPDFPQTEFGIHVVYPPGLYVQPKTRAFIDFLAEYFKTKAMG